MSWSESEKLNEWIQRAYENGRNEERLTIVKFLNSELHDNCKCPRCSVINEFIGLIGIGAE
jgi:hypothetical protein